MHEIFLSIPLIITFLETNEKTYVHVSFDIDICIIVTGQESEEEKNFICFITYQ